MYALTYIYTTQVEPHKRPLVQKTRLTLLFIKQPLQDLEDVFLVALVQGLPTTYRTSSTNFDRFVAYAPNRSAYGVTLMGHLTADRNLHILAAVCSTNSKPVLGACKLGFMSSGAGMIGL